MSSIVRGYCLFAFLGTSLHSYPVLGFASTNNVGQQQKQRLNSNSGLFGTTMPSTSSSTDASPPVTSTATNGDDAGTTTNGATNGAAPTFNRPPASSDKLQTPSQTEQELAFLQETANRLISYHRGSTLMTNNEDIEKLGRPVLAQNSPETLRQSFTEDAGITLPLEHHEPGWDITNNLESLQNAISHILSTSAQTSHPLFLNQLFAGVDPIALAGEWMSSTLNSNVHTFEVAPTATEMEKSCLDKIVRAWQKISAEDTETPPHDGLFVPGGSISILYSLLLARDRIDPNIRKTGMDGSQRKLVAFCSDSAHYSYKKGAVVTGLGENNIVAVKTLPNGAMDPEALKDAIDKAVGEGKTPFYVGTTAGTTVLGAYDEFDKIFDVTDSYYNNGDNHRIWTHIDGAWGGGAMLSRIHGHVMAGAERADSYSWNPHKMLGMPLQCSAFVTRHYGILAKCNSQAAEYLFQPDKENTDADLGDRTIQCGRKSDAIKLWLAWKMRGDDGLAAVVDRSFALAKFVQKEVEESEGRFVLVQPAQCSNIGFWYVPPRMRPFDKETATAEQWAELGKVAPKLKARMQAEGDAMIGFQPITNMGLVNFFRLVIPHPRHVTESDLRDMLDRMDQYGQEY